jgi:hypothetical protein
MNNRLFQKTGIKLTQAQMKILKELFWGILLSAILAAVVLAVGYATNVITLGCMHVVFSDFPLGSHHLSCIYQNPRVPKWSVAVMVALHVLIFLPFITDGVIYLKKLLFNPKFRENEMADSVDYKEEDEREQLMTMRATRRAYMVLNFTLLIWWFVCLLTGHFDRAVTPFIVQVIGALTYRGAMRS